MTARVAQAGQQAARDVHISFGGKHLRYLSAGSGIVSLRLWMQANATGPLLLFTNVCPGNYPVSRIDKKTHCRHIPSLSGLNSAGVLASLCAGLRDAETHW